MNAPLLPPALAKPVDPADNGQLDGLAFAQLTNQVAAQGLVLPPIAPESQRPRLPTPAEALEQIHRTLPIGVELHRSYHYQFPLGKREKLNLIILKIHCPEECEQKFSAWRSTIAGEIDPVVILVRRVRGTQNLWRNLRNKFPDTNLLTNNDRPVIQEMFKAVCGERPSYSLPRVAWDRTREDLTAVPFIAPDRTGVQDIEDLLHAERKPDGSYIWRTAIVDITDFVKPGSELDSQALRVGSTLRARRHCVPTLPEELAHDLASFREREVRPAWVLEGRLIPNHEETSASKKRAINYHLRYQVRRAYVVNHKSIDPSNVPHLQLDSPLARSMSALSEVARILRHKRASKPTPIRVEGTGALDMITAEVMIESKQLLTDYVGSRKGLPLCYRVHEKPSKAAKERFHRALNALGIPNSIEHFDEVDQFAGILDSLERKPGPASQALLNDLLDSFLLRSWYSADNHGHYGLRLRSYAEWKPRDAAGIANQFQLAALHGLHAPLTYQTMVDRANILNEKRWKRDERTINAIFLEALYHKLSLEGSLITGNVVALEPGKVTVAMSGFSKLATLRGAEFDSTLEVGSPIVGVFGGFNLITKEYEFHTVPWPLLTK